MLQEHVIDLLPGYALGILDEPDLLIVARHLPFCAECRAELSAFLETADRLALAIPPRTPPTDLRAKVVASAVNGHQAEALGAAELGTAARIPADGQRKAAGRSAVPARESGFLAGLRGLFTPRAGLALGVLALLVILALAANTFLLSQRVNNLQARLPTGSNSRVVQLTGTNNAPQAVGYMLVFQDDHYGTLTVHNAPVLDAAHQYQIWLVSDGKRVSGGVFSVNESGYGVLEIEAAKPLDTYQTFGITVEPAGGSPGPTGKKILGGKL